MMIEPIARGEQSGPAAEAIASIDDALRQGGPKAALERLVDHAARGGDRRAHLDALLLRARFELGLPLIPTTRLDDLPEPARTRYEDRYIEALREVGQKLLDAGDILNAWPYFRAIGEEGPVARALEQARLEPGDERIGAYIDIALYQGASPRHGFALVLEHYGICSAISSFEHLPAEETLRASCAADLVRKLREQLAANLRADITRSGQARPAEDTPIPALLDGRDWLFSDESYHIDISHLASVVRMSPLLNERSDWLLALELCEYGRRLSPRLRYDDPPPFEKTYEDHAHYLKALLGRDVEASLAHFRAKLGPADPEGGHDSTMTAQVLVGLLARLARWDEALDVAAEYLAGLPEGVLACPSLPRLCQRAGRLDRLAEVSRARGDLVHYLAARLEANQD